MQKGGPENPELLTPHAVLGAGRNNYWICYPNVPYLPIDDRNPIRLQYAELTADRTSLTLLHMRIDFTRADRTPQRWMLKQTPSNLTMYTSVFMDEMPQSILLPKYPFTGLRFLTTAVLTLKQSQPEPPAGIYQGDIDHERSQITEIAATLFFRSPSDAVMTLTNLLQAMRATEPEGHPFRSLPQAPS